MAGWFAGQLNNIFAQVRLNDDHAGFFQSMVEMDIEYLQQQSIREDLKLIFLTVAVVFRGRGGA